MSLQWVLHYQSADWRHLPQAVDGPAISGAGARIGIPELGHEQLSTRVDSAASVDGGGVVARELEVGGARLGSGDGATNGQGGLEEYNAGQHCEDRTGVENWPA